jgi:hypothetical protein
MAGLREAFAETGFWTQDAGAVAITVEGRLVGTQQFYRAGPGIRGYEIGYIPHANADRGRVTPARRCACSATCCSPSGRRATGCS